MVFTALGALPACGANAEDDVSRASTEHQPSVPPLVEPELALTPVGAMPTNAPAATTVAAPSPAAAPDCADERLTVPLSPSQPDRLQIVPGVFVERFQQLQLDGPLDYRTPAPAPEMWDRSETPEGACVFRIHGVDRRCVSMEQSELNFGSSGVGPSPRIGSYHKLNEFQQGFDPGCVAAPNTHWWYLNARDGAVDFVSCDAQCRSIGEGAQLVLRPAEPSAE